jgi:undecaprenyl diphosphate synthase
VWDPKETKLFSDDTGFIQRHKVTQFTEEYLEKTIERLGIQNEQFPRHIAIIMDGNGRWAQNRKLPRMEGHRQGGKTVEKIALDSVDLGIEHLILYAFSTENWKRPKLEIKALMHLYTQYLIGIRAMMRKNHVKLVHIGRKDRLPEKLRVELAKSMEMTAENDGMILALALDYGGRAEIIEATKQIAQDYKDGKIGLDEISEECMSSHLYTAGLTDPDLLIRTANERRISNFLPWQVSYSEFYVTDVYWPDFKKKDLEEAILEYAKRNRRFGNINQ